MRNQRYPSFSRPSLRQLQSQPQQHKTVMSGDAIPTLDSPLHHPFYGSITLTIITVSFVRILQHPAQYHECLMKELVENAVKAHLQEGYDPNPSLQMH